MPTTIPIRDDVVDVAALRLEVETLRARVLALEERRLSPWQRRQLAALLPAVAGVFGGDGFLVREITRSPAPALRIASRGLTAGAIGRLFAAAEGVAIDDLVIVDAGEEHNARRWCLERRD